MCFSVDLTFSRNSFNNVEKVHVFNTFDVQWFKELNQHWKDTSRPVPLFLVGTKKDLISDPATLSKLSENKETIVTMEEVRNTCCPEFKAEAMAKKLNAGGCLQCSAKTQEGLKPVFDSAVNVR